MRKAVTVGQYLIAISSKSVARTFHVTNQRSKCSTSFLVFEEADYQKLIMLLFEFQVSAGKYLMELVAADWFKDTKRMDHVAKRKGCAAQVSKLVWLINCLFVSHWNCFLNSCNMIVSTHEPPIVLTCKAAFGILEYYCFFVCAELQVNK